MELSEFTGRLRGELASITRFASEDVQRVAQLLAEALDSSMRLVLLDVLSAAAADITARLSDAVVELRLSNGEPTFVVMTAPTDEEFAGPARDTADAEEPGTARLTLRVPDSLKARIEAAAAREGMSVNTWLVRMAIRAVEAPSRGRTTPSRWGAGQRITGFARS